MNNIRALFTINDKDCILEIPTQITDQDHSVRLYEKDTKQELLKVDISYIGSIPEAKPVIQVIPEKPLRAPYMKGAVTDPKGVTYPSTKAMCEAWKVCPATYSNRRHRGFNMLTALVGLRGN